jgi:hypothetical protein
MKETRRMIMRRTKMAVLGMMMVLSMTACAGKAETKSIGAEITVQETAAEEMITETVKADRGESEESMIGMPNPYTDHGTLKEAEEDAGFKIQIPDEIRGVKAVAFRNLGTEMLEVIYYDGDAEVARVRKGTGADDISGDYNVYEIEEAVDVTGTQVTLKGSADGYALAVWNEGGYAYAVSVTKKITKDEILQIVEEIVKK